ncbi:MAG TPA: type IV secretion system DNA-binding domain-containing protein [Vicinamibacterales bacterium]|nr:type IV secretion system DNA-binding domain-containing protein [Vicinamibacterales bacterium]
MTRIKRILKDYTESGALNVLVSVHAAIDEHTLITKGGALVLVLRVEGVDYECLDPEQLDHVARRFEAALRTFDERFRVYQYVLKRNRPPLASPDHVNPVVQEAVADRIAHLNAKSNSLYSLNSYLALVYEASRPVYGVKQRLSEWLESPRAALREAFSSEHKLTVLENDLKRASEALHQKVVGFVAQLKDVLSLEILDKDQAFRFLRRLLNYEPFKAETVALKYDSYLDFQACDSTLECHRNHLRLDEHLIEVLTLKDPPAHTFAHLFGGLLEIPSNFVIVNEWKRESNLTMRRLIQSKRRHFHNSKSSLMNYIGSSTAATPRDMLIDDGAVAMVGDLGHCLEQMDVNGRTFGQFSMTVVLYDKDLMTLKRSVAECFKVLGSHDAQLTEERYNLLNAWLAVLPGNDVHNLRRLWLSDANYADLSLLFTQRTGRTWNAHLDAEYLALLETSAGTPYFLNLHCQDNAHTLVLGATGSGKSFFLSFLLTHAQKYQPITYIFDLGGSYQSLTRLFAGDYVRVGIDGHALAINPFALPATRDNLHFLFSFCRVLIESGGYSMNSSDDRDLSEQIQNLYAVEPSQRRLFTLANILPRALRGQLQKWIQGGQYGELFDNASGDMQLSRFQTFDFEGMEKYPQVLEPLLFYVLHCANAAIYDAGCGTTFKLFVMDEAWRFFRHPTIKLYILEALKTWRKKNAAMILATQSVDDLRRTEMLAVVEESCATRMFLANPGMDRAAYRELFHLNDTEVNLITRLVPKQQLLVKQPDLAKVVSLSVDPKGYWLYTTDPYDTEKKRDAFERYGFRQGLNVLAQGGFPDERNPSHRHIARAV